MTRPTSDTGSPRALPVAAWPDMRTLMGEQFFRDWDRRLKYRVRLGLTWRERAALLREAEQDGFAAVLLRDHPRTYYPVMTHLLHRALDARARLRATLASMHVLARALPARVPELLGAGIVVYRLSDDLSLELGLSAISYHEGLWQVALMNRERMRLYSVGFGFSDEHTLFIGNVQGVQECEDALERLKVATQAAHGMRPPHLLLHLLRLLARSWGVTRMEGIGPRNHVKGRRLMKPDRLWFDYPTFWTEAEGHELPGGNWVLPVESPRRPLEDVPSKRRAMYRRRYEMLDAIAERVAALATAAPESAPGPAVSPPVGA